MFLVLHKMVLCFSSSTVLPCLCVSQDELLAELDELEQEQLDNNLLEIGGAENVPLPNVPSTSLPSRPGETLWKNLYSTTLTAKSFSISEKNGSV